MVHDMVIGPRADDIRPRGRTRDQRGVMREPDGSVVNPPVPRAGEVGLSELVKLVNDGAPAGAGGGGGE